MKKKILIPAKLIILITFIGFCHKLHAQKDTLHIYYKGLQTEITDSNDVKITNWMKSLKGKHVDIEIYGYYESSEYKKFMNERVENLFMVVNRKARDLITVKFMGPVKGKKSQRSTADVVYISSELAALQATEAKDKDKKKKDTKDSKDVKETKESKTSTESDKKDKKDKSSEKKKDDAKKTDKPDDDAKKKEKELAKEKEKADAEAKKKEKELEKEKKKAEEEAEKKAKADKKAEEEAKKKAEKEAKKK